MPVEEAPQPKPNKLKIEGLTREEYYKLLSDADVTTERAKGYVSHYKDANMLLAWLRERAVKPQYRRGVDIRHGAAGIDGMEPDVTPEDGEPAPEPRRDEGDSPLITAMAQELKKFSFRAIENVLHTDKYEEIVRDLAGPLVDKRAKQMFDKLAKIKGRELTVTLPCGAKRDVGVQHPKFGDLLQAMLCGIPVLLVGPAGTGKTTAANKVAEALSVDFYFTSITSQTPEYKLFGYMDANGHYVTTAFRKAYEFGGVFLLDEMDNGNPNILAGLNAAIAQRECEFPDCRIKAHDDFKMCGAANTFGTGADRLYVGRNALDWATLDRFITLDWDADEQFEQALFGDTAWVITCQDVRLAIGELNLRHVVGLRAMSYGSLLLETGWTPQKAAEVAIWKGLARDARERVMGWLRDKGRSKPLILEG